MPRGQGSTDVLGCQVRYNRWLWVYAPVRGAWFGSCEGPSRLTAGARSARVSRLDRTADQGLVRLRTTQCRTGKEPKCLIGGEGSGCAGQRPTVGCGAVAYSEPRKGVTVIGGPDDCRVCCDFTVLQRARFGLVDHSARRGRRSRANGMGAHEDSARATLARGDGLVGLGLV